MSLTRRHTGLSEAAVTEGKQVHVPLGWAELR